MPSQNQQLVSPYGVREGGCQDNSDDHQYTDDDEWKPRLQEGTNTERSGGGKRPVGDGGGGGGGGGEWGVGSGEGVEGRVVEEERDWEEEDGRAQGREGK